MNDKKYLPLNKEDLAFMKELNKIENINTIKEDIPILIEWLQDFNWEQADLICDYLLKFPLVTYKQEIIEVLNSNDDMWKYWILLRLVKPIITKEDDWLISKIENIMIDPTLGEKESEVDEIAEEIINKLTIDS